MSPELGIGVDLGATRIRVCVGDKDGKVLWKSSREMPLPKEVDAYVDEVVGTVRLATEHIKAPARLKGVGVASAGPLDLKRGCLARPANLPYKSVPIVAPLEERFGTRVTLLNDADAAALGERRFGAGKDHENLVYITLSTGIGGGAIVDGHLLIGKDGNAGEIGHLVVDSAGRLECGCGGRGHWEACCSGRGIPKLAELVAAERGGTGGGKSVGELLGESGPIDSATILKSASKGNQFGIRVAEEVGRLNALGVANTVNMFDPSLVTIGGAVALNNRELILGPIRERVPLNAVNRVPKIIITPLGDDVGLLGALTLVFGDGTLR